MRSPPFRHRRISRSHADAESAGATRTISGTELSLGKRLFFRALVASLAATAGLAILVLLFAEFDETAGRILTTTALLSLFSLLSLPAGVLLDERRHPPLAWTVIALSALAFAIAMLLLWGEWDESDNEPLWKLLATAAALAAACSQTAAMTSRRRPADGQGVRRIYRLSIVLAFLLSGLIVAAVWGEIDRAGYYRVLGAVAVANVLVVVLQPIMRRLGALGAARGSGAYRIVFTLDRDPPQEAVDEAVRTLERAGAQVERVERAPTA